MYDRYEDIIQGRPIIVGEWTNPNQVAEYISTTHHSSILSFYLLFAYKGDTEIKSLIITTGPRYGIYSISIFYDNFQMIYQGMNEDYLSNLIDSFSSNKKLKVLYEGLINRFKLNK